MWFFIFISLICLVSCSNPVCLSPLGGVDTKVTSRFTLIIKPGSEGKDVGVSTYYLEENFSSVKSLNAFTLY